MSVTAYHFWSPTCAPCKVIKPAIEDLKEDFPHVQWISVNTQDDPNNYSETFGVSIVPTIVVVAKDIVGNILSIERHSGTTMMGYHRILRNSMKLAHL
jgi:thiol-disulfide isomerase/thioredoxin